MMLAITYFFMHGIEELPYPEGAILFNSEEIAKSIFVFFISSIVFINKTFFAFQNKTEKPTATTSNNKWEQATMEDLASGNFEPI